ncbi:MAG: T9SS type A sorting domain-containing protein [Bacteroidia bacterium]
MKRILPALIMLLAGCLQVHSQNIGIVPNSLRVMVNQRPFATSDTIRTNDVITYELVFQNTSTIDIFNPIDLVISGQDSMSVDTLLQTGASDTLMANDTLRRAFIDTVDAADRHYFSPNGGGAIVVVVWPAVRGQANIPVMDSSSLTLFRDYPASVKPLVYESLMLYPNPVSDQLRFEFIGAGRRVDHVRITDGLGRACLLDESKGDAIDVRGLAPGRYWLRLQFSDGSYTIRCFVKQ